MSSQNKTKIMWVVVLGTALEWMEFSVFAYLSPVISRLFFPQDLGWVASLKVYSVWGVSYFARPFGALLFGMIGDHYGRKNALLGSMILMFISSFLMGILPTYEQVSYGAPIALVVLRVLQGVAVSGEFNGAVIFSVESFGEKRPYFIGMWTPFAASLGMLIGSFLCTLIFMDGVPEYSWRFVFLLSGLGGLVSFFLRKNMVETKEFMTRKRKLLRFSDPLKEVLTSDRLPFITCFFAAMFVANFVYIGNVYYKSLLLKSVSLSQASFVTTVGQLITTFVILFVGLFADFYQVRRLTTVSLVFAAILSPLMMACSYQEGLSPWLGQVIYGLLNGTVSATLLTYVTMSFSTSVRYSGSSFGWSLGSALFGGTSLVVSELLVKSGVTWLIGWYLSFGACLLVCCLELSKNSGRRFLYNPGASAKSKSFSKSL